MNKEPMRFGFLRVASGRQVRRLAARILGLAMLLTVFGAVEAADGLHRPETGTSIARQASSSMSGRAAESLGVLPDEGRGRYLQAFRSAKREIRIEICVLEDPEILQGLKQALERGVRVRAIVDNGKYQALAAERNNAAEFLKSGDAQIHLSHPVFPRSFPKVILIDNDHFLLGSACLDSTTFNQYRDYVYSSHSREILQDLSGLFENDWKHSAAPGREFPAYNPVSAFSSPDLIVAPINATSGLVRFFQRARKTLDVTSELMGNPTLEAELAAAVSRGVKVRLIAPETVNGGTPEIQALQSLSLKKLAAAGVAIHVTRAPENAQTPYMHARSAVADRKVAYLGSISLSPDSATRNRGVGLIVRDAAVVKKLQRRFDADFAEKSIALQ